MGFMAAKRILVVDDDAAVRESIEMMLDLDGHIIQFAESGAQALERYAPSQFDVVLTDNRMPGMSGIQLAQAIKSQNPSQVIILFSGSPPMGPASACDMILLKPFSAAALRTAVRTAAERGQPSDDAPSAPD